jgi:hypothetical protein
LGGQRCCLCIFIQQSRDCICRCADFYLVSISSQLLMTSMILSPPPSPAPEFPQVALEAATTENGCLYMYAKVAFVILNRAFIFISNSQLTTCPSCYLVLIESQSLVVSNALVTASRSRAACQSHLQRATASGDLVPSALAIWSCYTVVLRTCLTLTLALYRGTRNAPNHIHLNHHHPT